MKWDTDWQDCVTVHKHLIQVLFFTILIALCIYANRHLIWTSVFLCIFSDLVTEFLNILDKCPNKLKKKIMGWKVSFYKYFKYYIDLPVLILETWMWYRN